MNKKTKIPCTVGILTFNSGKTLEACLESVKEFDEIIICDGGSSDTTREIAERYGCTIIDQSAEFKRPDGKLDDFSGVRNQTLDAAKHDWFTYVDSDEYFSREVVSEIRAIIGAENPPGHAYKMPRKYVIEGEIIECASSYPNYQIRFFHKRAVNRFIKKVHERIEVKKDYALHALNHCEYVPLEGDLTTLKSHQAHYVQIEIKRYKDISFWRWFRWVFLFGIRSMLIYTLRYMYLLVFCRGKRLSFQTEWLKIDYNLKLIWGIGKNVFRSTKK